jgi:hypothetical protein
MKENLNMSAENVDLGEKIVDKNDPTAFYYESIEVRGLVDPEAMASQCLSRLSAELDKVYGDDYAGRVELVNTSNVYHSISFFFEYRGVDISTADLKRHIVDAVVATQI